MSIQEYNPLNWGKYKVLLYLRDLFSQQSRDLYRFDNNSLLTKIHIRDKNAVKLESPSDVPILAVSRGALRSQERFVGDFESHNYETGTTEYNDVFEYNVTINCLSRVGLEAEEVASIVFGGLKFNRNYIMSLGFARFSPPAIGEEQSIIVNSDLELVNVPVVVSLAYVVRWTHELINPSKHETTSLEFVNITVET